MLHLDLTYLIVLYNNRRFTILEPCTESNSTKCLHNKPYFYPAKPSSQKPYKIKVVHIVTLGSGCADF